MPSRGTHLEQLVLTSQGAVTLTKIPNGIKYLRGGDKVPVKGPVDFMGCYTGSGIALVLDAKEGGGASLNTSTDHVAEHQRLALLRFWDAGAVSGLLCLSTRTDTLYWLPAPKLHPRRPSVPWGEMVEIGSAKYAIDWRRVASADAWARGWLTPKATDVAARAAARG